MDHSDRVRIRAYLLHRLSVDEQNAFEARLLEEEDLLRAVKDAEDEFLAYDPAHTSGSGKRCAVCFLGGAVTAGLLLEVARRLL